MSHVQPLLDNLAGQDDEKIIDIIFTVWIDCHDAEGYDEGDIVQTLEYVRDTWDQPVVKTVAQKHIDVQSQWI